MAAPASDVWSRFSCDPRDPEAAAVRVTDADRDVAGEVVRDAFVDGKLTRDEHDERSSEVMAARTAADLLSLLSDLVPLGRGQVVRRPSTDIHAQAVAKYQRDLRDARNGWVFVSVLTTAIWAATSLAGQGPYFFWPVFPIIGVGIGYFSTRLNAESRIEDIEDKLLEKQRRRRGIDASD